MTDAGSGREDFNDVRDEFMRTHHDMLVDPRNDVEALDRAGCGPRVTDLARLAIAVSADGRSAEDWRTWIREALGPPSLPHLETAEACMRENGLWPWAQDGSEV